MNQQRLAQAIADLDAWLESMRQAGGYGGPVAHWWQNRFQYVGPGLDWRYEGILSGYATLYEKTRSTVWCRRAHAAAEDLLLGQLPDGSYRASRFEINPGTLGTPHEAAASYGLLVALPLLPDRSRVLQTVENNLVGLIRRLWDGHGFNDRPGVVGRVPNKLATLALALIRFVQITGEDAYLPYARAALDDIVRLQDRSGAVHQCDPGSGRGDGRFFPLYNARCVAALRVGSDAFSQPEYRASAERIQRFLIGCVDRTGWWPQVIYAGGRTAEWPKWYAGSADILGAIVDSDSHRVETTVERLLNEQLSSGGFRTGTGFRRQITQSAAAELGDRDDWRDVVPVVGWNDKMLLLLAQVVGPGVPIPSPSVSTANVCVDIGGVPAEYRESAREMSIASKDRTFFHWDKSEPWARTVDEDCRAR